MEFQKLRSEINAVLDKIEQQPEARDRLQADLREKVAELEALGIAMPNKYKTLGEDSDAEADDFFENMPV